jgi:hypothetical protein
MTWLQCLIVAVTKTLLVTMSLVGYIAWLHGCNACFPGCNDCMVAMTWLQCFLGCNHLVAMLSWLQSLGYNDCMVTITWLQH